MAALLWVLLALAGLLLAAVVLVLATPVRLGVLARAGPDACLRLELGLLGPLGPRLALVDTARPRAGPDDARPGRKARGKRGRRRGPEDETVLRMIRAFPDLLLGVLSRFRVERFRVDADYGTGDPAATGEIHGWACTVLYGSALRRTEVALRPDFTARRFEGELEAAIRFTPVTLLVPLSRFAWRVFVRQR